MSLDWSSVKALSIPVAGVARDVKRVTAGGVTLWEKPNPVPYDAEVDWVEATGEQWVDTLCAVTADTRIEATWRQTSVDIQQRLFGVNDGLGAVFACYLNNNGVWAVNTGTQSGGAIGSAVQTGIDYSGTFNLSTGVCTINGTTRSNGGTPFNSANTIPIFARRNTGTVQLTYLAEMRLMSFGIYRGGVLVRDYIPVRVGSGASAVGYLYDRANPTGGPLGNGLYGSATATPLEAGPDANA